MDVRDVGVRRALYWVGVGLIAFNFPLSVVRALAYPSAYVPGFAATVLAAIGALLAWAAVRCVRRLSARGQLGGIVVVACVVLPLHPWVTGPDPVAYPPLFHVLGAAMCISALISVSTSAVIIPLFSFVVAWQRSAELGVTRAASEALLLALSGGIASACVNLLERADRSVTAAVAATRRLEEDSHRAQRRAYEREHWDALVHDKVLGALHLTTRATSDEFPAAARELAEEAEAAFLGGPAGPWGSPRESLARHAARLGLEADIRVLGRLSDLETEDAVIAAAQEALTNVARHSGQRTVSITGSLSDGGTTVVVNDPGCGFDPAAASLRTGGIPSINGRMRAVGGRADVKSTPGAGTTVTIEWQPPPRGPEPTHWQLRTFAPMMILGALAVALNVTMGRQQWLSSRSVTLAVLGILAIVVLTAVVSLSRPTSRAAIGLAAAMIGLSALLAANTPDFAVIDWRYWYLGALTAAVGAFSFRFRPAVGLATGAGMILAVMLVDTLVRQAPFACLGGPVPVLIATAVAGYALRRALDDSWRRVAQSTAADAELRLAIAAEEERAREAELRVNALAGSVAPALDLIASGVSLTTEKRRWLLLLEASVRDHLAAPALLDATLVEALLQARTRGARIDVVMVRSADQAREDQTGQDGYRRVLCDVLQHVPTQARVQATWRPGTELSGSTISVVAADLIDLRRNLYDTSRDLPAERRPLVSHDEDSLFIEFHGAARSPSS